MRTPPPDRQQARIDMGQRLVALRERAGLTQVDVARRLHVRQATVSAWETGESEPQIFDAQALCELFGTGLEAILPPKAPRAQAPAA